MGTQSGDQVRLVYRPKTQAEARRRASRVDALLGTPFVCLPGNPPDHKVLFVSKEGHKVRVKDIEMVFNDALLSDAVSNWGEDGPLYCETLDSDVHREAWEYAVKAYAGVELPEKLRNPRKPS
jgi:hypothetical protein